MHIILRFTEACFSPMPSAGFSFYILEGLGVEVCSLDAVLVSATVCERPSWQTVAVPMGKLAKGVSFGCFKCDVASFRVASVALCDMWMRDRGGRKLPCL